LLLIICVQATITTETWAERFADSLYFKSFLENTARQEDPFIDDNYDDRIFDK